MIRKYTESNASSSEGRVLLELCENSSSVRLADGWQAIQSVITAPLPSKKPSPPATIMKPSLSATNYITITPIRSAATPTSSCSPQQPPPPPSLPTVPLSQKAHESAPPPQLEQPLPVKPNATVQQVVLSHPQQARVIGGRFVLPPPSTLLCSCICAVAQASPGASVDAASIAFSLSKFQFTGDLPVPIPSQVCFSLSLSPSFSISFVY